MNINKPLGIKIIGSFWIISGIAVYIEILQYFIRPIDSSVMELSPYDSARGILFIFLGIGIIKLRQWARIAALIISAVGIPVSIYIIIFKEAVEGLIVGVAPLIINCIVLYYFTRENIKNRFNNKIKLMIK
ncbi:MAG: hypothetical protein PHR23_06590 [bacterium]|jgi:uncharacterized membrane protein (DUF2068 family)|nr:hypothetical protein [bacterium]